MIYHHIIIIFYSSGNYHSMLIEEYRAKFGKHGEVISKLNCKVVVVFGVVFCISWLWTHCSGWIIAALLSYILRLFYSMPIWPPCIRYYGPESEEGAKYKKKKFFDFSFFFGGMGVFGNQLPMPIFSLCMMYVCRSTGCLLNIVFFSRILEGLPPLPRLPLVVQKIPCNRSDCTLALCWELWMSLTAM